MTGDGGGTAGLTPLLCLALVENSILATSLTTPDGRFAMVNPAMCRWLGYDADTLMAKTWQEITARVNRDSAAAETNGHAGAGSAEVSRFADLMTGRASTYQGELQFIHADGRPLWGYMSVFALRDGQGALQYLVGQTADITEQVALRNAKSESDARFRKLMDNTGVGTAMNYADGRFAEVNQALCDLLGYDAETLTTMTWQDLTPQKQLESDLARIEDLEAGRIETYRVAKQFIHADGHLFWVDLSVSCIRNPDGSVQYFIAQFVDIDDEVRAREQLAQREIENRALAERLRAEIANAADYVMSVLPDEMDGPVQVTSRYLPALDLGGDGFNYRWLDEDHLKVYLIDASGHGIRPALLSMSVHNLIRSGTLPHATLLDPARMLDTLNGLFQMTDQGGSYFTIWYGVYQKSTRTMRYASAGHPPALVLIGEGSGDIVATTLSTPGIPIGMFGDTTYSSAAYPVPRGAQILLYSDGVIDLPVHNSDNPWPIDGFVELCSRVARDPDWTLDDLVTQLREVSPSGGFDDDCALVRLTFP